MKNEAAKNELLYFESLKAHRGAYFVSYSPPPPTISMAFLSLVFIEPVEPSQAATALKYEVQRWLARYPVPLMASVVDEKEDPIPANEADGSHQLFAWLQPQTKEIAYSWEPTDLDAFLKAHPTKLDLRTIYADLPFKTDAEVKANAQKYVREQQRHKRVLTAVLVGWLAVIPAAVAIFEFFGPQWLGVIALGYAIWKSWRAYLKLIGRAKPSLTEAETVEKQSKMRHYYYHCERNPRGFQKLMLENLAEDIGDQNRKEAARLSGQSQ